LATLARGYSALLIPFFCLHFSTFVDNSLRKDF
jgi:hypothetical protein